jgi:hypothetical protein
MAGETPSELLSKLKARLSEDEANEIISGAALQYEELRQSGSLIDRDAAHQDLLEQLVRGETSESLYRNLSAKISDDTARQMVEKAVAEYERIKKEGQLQELEYQTFFKPKPTSAADKAALWAIFAGLALTAISYLTAAPGGTYTLFVGLIAVGVFRLAYSGLRE